MVLVVGVYVTFAASPAPCRTHYPRRKVRFSHLFFFFFPDWLIFGCPCLCTPPSLRHLFTLSIHDLSSHLSLPFCFSFYTFMNRLRLKRVPPPPPCPRGPPTPSRPTCATIIFGASSRLVRKCSTLFFTQRSHAAVLRTSSGCLWLITTSQVEERWWRINVKAWKKCELTE